MRAGSVPVAFLVAAAAAAVAAAAPSDEVADALDAIRQLRLNGDVQSADKAAADLVAKHPESIDAHVAFQDAELAVGHDKDVLDVYRKAAAAPDANADAHCLCARLLRGAPAVSEFRAALKADPHHFWAMCGLGMELTRTRAFGEARSTLEDAAKEQPKSAVPVNALGRVEEAKGRALEAEKLYRAALELDPTMTIARVNLGVLLAGMGKKDDAVKMLEDAATRAPKDPTPLIGLGMAYLGAKDPTSAVSAFRRASDIDSDDVTALALLGSAYIDLAQLDSADEVLQSALKKAPRSVTANVDLAYVRTLQGKYDDASKYATQAVALDDSSAEAHYVLGLVLDHQVQGKKAEAEFRRAQKLDADNPAYVRATAALAVSSGDWGTAISEYQKAVRMTGGSADSLMDLAAAYTGAKQHSSAASTYDQVVAAEPGRLPAWLQLGIVCARDLKDGKRAVKAFKEYVRRGGTDPRVAGWIAQLSTK
jgi:tetratricopeptide (TPR) repeat protein